VTHKGSIDKMKRKYVIVIAFLAIVSVAIGSVAATSPTPQSNRTLLSYPNEMYSPDDYTAETPNFADFPPDFSNGTLAWNLDIIDVEATEYDGEGIYVAVLDTGLVANWRDYFPEERIATKYGIGFCENVRKDKKTDELIYSGTVHRTTFLGKLSHGTHITSTIIGYSYYGEHIRGVAPKVKIIPVKVLNTYEGLDGKKDEDEFENVFGTDLTVAAGINYIADLAESEGIKIVISMSIGAPEPSPPIKDAIDHAIENGVIVVVAAGNNGKPMGWPADPDTWFLEWPGAYPEVICVGSSGWGMGVDEDGYPKYPITGEWEPWPQIPRTWWYQDVSEDMEYEISYISYFSSREYVNPAFPNEDVELDVVAPGSWILGPYPGDTSGYRHIPWWAKGNPWNPNAPPPNYWYVGGTSMATPHVSGVAALMLEKDPTLTQKDVEDILKNTSTPLPTAMLGYPFAFNYVRWPCGGIYPFCWAADATGAGIIQADAAIAAIPTP
jgi:subtilisin family serine protease